MVGCSSSKGYREFKGNDDIYQKEILSFVFVEAGNILTHNKIEEENDIFYYDPSLLNDYEEIATFYIGNKWLGINTKEIIKSISIDNLEKPINPDRENHHFKGSVVHEKLLVNIIDISFFIDNNNQIQNNKEIIIVKDPTTDETQTLGIIIDRLGEIVKVPKDKIKPFQKHLIGGGSLGESIVVPPENSDVKSLITLLNISKLDQLAN